MQLEVGGESDEGWKAIKSKNKDVYMSMTYFPPQKGERSVATGRAEGVMDCSAEKAAAYFFDYCSRQRMRKSQEKMDPARLVVEGNAALNEATVATVKVMPFLLKDREFVVKMIWKADEAGITVAFESVDLDVDYGVSLRTFRGFTRALYRIENLQGRGQVMQCRCTIYLKVDAGGVIPTSLMNRRLPQALGVLQQAIDEFRQDDKIDEVNRAELATLMREKHDDQEYSEEELAVLERGHHRFEDVDEADYEHIESPDVFVKMDMVMEEGASVVVGRAVTIVDATAEDCATWGWAKMTREQMRLYRESGGLKRSVVKLNNHSELFHLVIDLGVPGFQPREWLIKGVWKKQDDGSLVTAYEDVEHEDFPEQSGKYVRASALPFWRFEKLPPRGGGESV